MAREVRVDGVPCPSGKVVFGKDHRHFTHSNGGGSRDTCM